MSPNHAPSTLSASAAVLTHETTEQSPVLSSTNKDIVSRKQDESTAQEQYKYASEIDESGETSVGNVRGDEDEAGQGQSSLVEEGSGNHEHQQEPRSSQSSSMVQKSRLGEESFPEDEKGVHSSVGVPAGEESGSVEDDHDIGPIKDARVSDDMEVGQK